MFKTEAIETYYNLNWLKYKVVQIELTSLEYKVFIIKRLEQEHSKRIII